MRSFLISVFLLLPLTAFAQTDIHITGPQAGFPVAIPKLCDSGNGGEFTSKIAEKIVRNLEVTGIFRVLNASTYVEAPGKCSAPDQIAYSDWSVIGAEGLVKGEVRSIGTGGSLLEIKLYLYDVLQQRAVVGKRYESSPEDYQRVANRFTDEVMKFFTGELGVFGTKIAYISRIGRFKELFVMDLDGTNSRQLTRDKGLVLSPAWSPRGDKILFTSYSTKKPELYYISSGGGNTRRLTKRTGLELGAEYSPDGQEIVTSATVLGVSNIVKLDLKGNLTAKLTTSSAIDVSPSYSPDGKYLAFCSNRSGGPQIYVISSKGGRAKRISFTQSNYCTSPAWSPKGDKIAFVCRNRGNQLYVSGTDGSRPVQLTFQGNSEDPAWSPDGRFLAFSSDFGRGGPRNLALMPLLTGRPKQISFSRSEDSMPAWSPRLDY